MLIADSIVIVVNKLVFTVFSLVLLYQFISYHIVVLLCNRTLSQSFQPSQKRLFNRSLVFVFLLLVYG